MNAPDQALHPPRLRWGFVGTGNIASWMAGVVRDTPAAELTAVASRTTASASAFMERHGIGKAFDSWSDMLSWEGIDAVYVATPTAPREAICIAAARAGKHVLAEKPFASLPSVRRITAACRDNGVAFMDATHFVHHPRTAAVLACMADVTGPPRSLDTSFLVSLDDRRDIRYDPALEPLGALGDLGWYSMRATLEYLRTGAGLRSAATRLARDARTGAITAGTGSLTFEDGTVSTWRCSFDAGAPVIELGLSGPLGQIAMDNFVGESADGSASYRHSDAAGPDSAETLVTVESHLSGPSLMFRDFAAAAADTALRDRWMLASERTQALIDAALDAAQA